MRSGNAERRAGKVRVSALATWAAIGAIAWLSLQGLVPPDLRALAAADAALVRGRTEQADAGYARFVGLNYGEPGAPRAALGTVIQHITALRGKQAALSYIERLVAAQPANQTARLMLAVTYDDLGRDKDAERIYNELLRTHPNDPDALNALGYLYARRGERLDDAIPMLRRALSMAPGDGGILDSLAWAYYQHGDIAVAVEALSHAVKACPSSAEVRYHYGVALARMDMRNQDAAIVELGKAVLLAPEMKGAREALRKVRNGQPPPCPVPWQDQQLH